MPQINSYALFYPFKKVQIASNAPIMAAWLGLLLLAKPDALDNLGRAVSALESGQAESSSTAYGSLLRRCGNARALSQGRRVHAQMIKNKRSGDEYLANLLLRMYGQCGSLEDACALFNSMSKNQYSWNIMIAVYAQNGDLKSARNIFDEMPQRDVASWTAMLVAFSQFGRIPEAESIFDQMPLRSVVSWNAMLSAYNRNGKSAEAVKLFGAMDLAGEQPDKITFIAVFDACASLQAADLGLSLHADCKQTMFQSDIAVVTSLVQMYSKCSLISTARSLFDSVASPDPVLWAAMISAYAQTGSASEAAKIFNAMPEKMRGSVACTSMITAYARAGDQIHNAKAIFDSMPSTSINRVSWNALITAYAQCENSQAFHLFKLMDLEGMQPDAVTFTAVIDSCSSSCEGKLIHEVLEEQRSEIRSHFAVQTALVAMYGKCGQLSDAKQVFNKLRHCDVKSWTAMISAFSHRGLVRESMELFQAMQLHGWSPNEVTFISVLAVCSHAGLLSDAYLYFVSLSSDYALKPQLDHYMCIVDVLGRSGRVLDAAELIASMPFQPNAVAWTALLSAWRSTASDPDADLSMQKAAQSVCRLDPGSSAPYTLLCNLHRKP